MTALRPALAADAPALAVLAERTFRDTFGSQNTPANMDLLCANAFSPEIQRNEIEDSGVVTIIAEDQGAMIGFYQLRLARPHESVHARRPAELHRIYVIAQWQGRGVARDLMQHSIDTAMRKSCDVLWLGVWEHNPKAMAFYRKFGLEIVGSHAFKLGQERQRDMIMAVKLG